MSNMARSDEIDELVSSVRNLVSYKDAGTARRLHVQDKLILTPALRIDIPASEAEVAEISQETAADHDAPLQGPVTTEKPTLGATAAELEAAVTARAEDWEADGGETFDQAAWAASAFEPPQDDSAALGTPPAESIPDVALPLAEPELPTQNSPELSDLEDRIADQIVAQHGVTSIDEGALRAAVVRILREELAGDMGERITRNVRKLVRREINRVLVSRDLD